jgi:hypothetical protein
MPPVRPGEGVVPALEISDLVVGPTGRPVVRHQREPAA